MIEHKRYIMKSIFCHRICFKIIIFNNYYYYYSLATCLIFFRSLKASYDLLLFRPGKKNQPKPNPEGCFLASPAGLQATVRTPLKGCFDFSVSAQKEKKKPGIFDHQLCAHWTMNNEFFWLNFKCIHTVLFNEILPGYDMRTYCPALLSCCSWGQTKNGGWR